ncbi:amino acid permease/ SLC12A domain-containing protein [Melanogaster broomeanus]|nr:amino acid permease/ SLC12A domain-containing protein [Melanogaster broomeanus]
MNSNVEGPAEDTPRVETFTIDDGEVAPERQLLKQRHVQMQVCGYIVLRSLTFLLSNRIAIAGTLGTGLFLGSGEALTGAGPLGALIAYVLVSTVAFASLCSIGEMTSFAPIPGTFPHYASRWVDPALGFAVGWNYFYTNALTLPVEISGAQLLIGYWDHDPNHQWIYIAIMCTAACAINVLGARWFGEAEFVFSFMKLTLITVLILIGLVIDLGGAPNHDRIGFRYWKDPGPFSRPNLVHSNPDLDRFLGFLSVILQAAFSFQGMEIAAIAAVVTESPRRNVTMAIRKSFYRILFFYIIGILIAGMTVSSKDGGLLTPFSDSTTANVTRSPFVIAVGSAGSKGLTYTVNAGLVTSAFSAGNSFLFAASRVLEALAYRNQAPVIFRHRYNDTPIAAVLFTSAFGLISFLSLSHGTVNVFRSGRSVVILILSD